MKTNSRLWLYVVPALVLILALGYAFAPRPLAVETAQVTRGSLRETVDEEGRTRIKERYVLSAPLNGQLRRIELHPGDCVEAGKTLVAVIEPTEPELLDPRSRAQAEARLRTADAQFALTTPRADRVRATLELALAELTRAEKLFEQQAISIQDLDHARETARAAAEDLKAADYARQVAGFEKEQAQAALLRTGPRTAESWEFQVRAPVDGRVLRVFHEDAAVVGPGTRLLEIGDPSSLEAEIDVLSSDAVRIKPGARVIFEHWGGDTPLEGRVRLVEPAGFLKISALGVEEQRVNVIADFLSLPEQRRDLGDAYRVEARIVVWESDSVLKAPVGALFRSKGQWSVFVVRSGRARVAPVTIGHSNGRECEIVRGLAQGDVLIVHASDKVAEGVAVTAR